MPHLLDGQSAKLNMGPALGGSEQAASPGFRDEDFLLHSGNPPFVELFVNRFPELRPFTAQLPELASGFVTGGPRVVDASFKGHREKPFSAASTHT